MSSAYTPRPGSVAERVIWYLEQHGASSTTSICEDVEDVPRQALIGCLATAIMHGALFTEKRDGENWYGVKPFASQEPATPARASAEPSSVTVAAPMHVPADVHANKPKRKYVRKAPPPAAPVVVLTEQLPTRAPRAFGCGIFSDGRLVLELASGDDVVLLREETRALVTFLDRALHEELTA